MSLEDIRNERIRKLDLLKKEGINPYPARSLRTTSISDLLADFDERAREEVVTVAGRVMAIREHGGSAFIDLYDGSGSIQGYLKADELGEQMDLFLKVVDIGDFIDCSGTPTTTKRGERSILASKWRMLSKSLLPLPEKWHGIQDVEERLRHRYLDILFNDEVREMVERRAVFWRAVREFHEERGFLEVATPVLEVTTGGADARPFITHHNALDMDVYLRISAGELWQKRLMVAGIPKTFEIGRVFRNEGISAEHAQDYVQCEAYWAYASASDMWTFLRECYQYVIDKTFGTLSFTIRGMSVDFSGEWPTIDYTESISQHTGIDIWHDSESTIIEKLNSLGVGYEEGMNRQRLVDALWKHIRKGIAGPAILINEPTFMSPLAKKSETDKNIVERFHFIIAGSEVGQGYSELNDPLDQRARFSDQQKLREAGDEEAQMPDWDFVEALEHGMPPTAGHGFSERLFALLLDKPIREIQLFPLMRPKER